MQISGKSSIYCIIGDPVAHSMSPIMQNAAFQSISLDAVYVPFRVERSMLQHALQGLRALDVRGFNVTAPHKVAVIPYLDRVSKAARQIGSVNTVIDRGTLLFGYNTDGIGALKSIQDKQIKLKDRSILILGAGGLSRAITHTFAPHTRSIHILNRTLPKAKLLKRELERKFNVKVEVNSLSVRSLKQVIPESDVIVNASSMGLNGQANPPVRADWFHTGQCVFEAVYKPLHTKLLKMARRAGAKTVTGLDLLVNQGAASFEIWTERNAPVSIMRSSIEKVLELRSHARSG